MNCDLIAPFYWLLETIAFGNRLQQHRTTYLSAFANASRVLILGDGDGRFAQALAHAYPSLEIDSLELSGGMLLQASKRLAATRVHLTQGNAIDHPLRKDHYDVICSHFFLDCFDTATVSDLVANISRASKTHSLWIISDFRQLEKGWRKFFSKVWLATMYFFFRLATRLKTTSLPDYSTALRAHGFTLENQSTSLFGFIASERWQRNATS